MISGSVIIVIIKEVLTRTELKAFVKFPNTLYKNSPYHVTSLISDEIENFDREKNPAFEFCDAAFWVALEEDHVIGRIAAIINHKAIEKFSEKRGRFGYVDFIDDDDVSAALFKVAEDWLKERGITKIQGPLGFSDLDEEGMLTEGFDEMGTLTTIYNYAYYPEHLKKLGYQEDVRWFEYTGNLPKPGNVRMTALAENIKKRYGLKIIQLKKRKDVLAYAHSIFELINASYDHLYNITPLSEKQMQFYTRKYLSFIKLDFVKLIVDREDKLIAFAISFPSLAQAMRKANGHILPFGIFHILKAFRKNDRVELLLIAVDPKYSRKGIPSILFEELISAYDAHGITQADFNPQLEDNRSVRNLWHRFDLRQNKKRDRRI